jgi:uncharacterized OsmC-like protein
MSGSSRMKGWLEAIIGRHFMNLQMNFDCQRAQLGELSPGRVIVAETGNNQHQQLLFAGRHILMADRPGPEGGGDTGPDPQSLMLMALGSQISMALRESADRNGWRLDQIVLQFNDTGRCLRDRRRGNGHRDDFQPSCVIDFVGDLYDWQQAQLITIAKRHIAAWSSLVAA